MSPQYTPLHQTSTHTYDEHEDYLESLQNIPSNFDLALNGNGGTNRSYLSPHLGKSAENSLLEPDAFRRLSMSTISSVGRGRSVSPYPPHNSTAPSTWKEILWDFWDQNQGLFLVTFSQLFGALMNVATRLLELEGEGMDPFQILFARQGITAIFCTAWMWYGNVPGFPLGERGIRGLLVARSLTGFVGIFGMYYSLQYLPVADAVVITFLAPSIASYGCYIFLREPFPRSAQYASLISLLGVVLIARPTSFLTSSSPDPSTTTSIPSNTTTSTADPTDPSSFPIPTSSQRLSAVIVAMVGVLGSAGAFTSIRWIGTRAHPLLSVNYFSVFCTLIATLVLSLAQPLHLSSTLHFALPAGLRQWSMLIFLGACGFVMQYLLTKGLAAGGRGSGARATNMIYTNMLFALALDKVVFGQSPGVWSLAGSGLILGSAIFVAVRKGKGVGEGGERGGGVDVEMVGRGEGGGPEEEMAMLGGELDDDDNGGGDEEIGPQTHR
ncbi:integral membrane protein DUF6 [Rhexocercosporidium sp. MPI-PUGE-AT-0058]|nr:integral membrane protein DUF6 [Rhexocercosporidium sp. MPI-PUGE-AT-0058]